MQTVATTSTSTFPAVGLARQAGPPVCVHCGARCLGLAVHRHSRDFCCQGCLTVYELLQENGLADFYELSENPGVQIQANTVGDRFAFLDEEPVRGRLLDFSDGSFARITLCLPSIHCVACVWLLENLFKLNGGIGRSVVNFEKKQATITFEPDKIELSELVSLLVSIGYEPELQLDSLEQPDIKPSSRSLYLKLGVAGFAFGNIMLFSICLYSGMDRFSEPLFKPLFGWVSVILSLPVLLYSAGSYWRGAWLGLRQKSLTIDLPIAIGLVALFGQSLHEIITQGGVGYLDSLAGLVFFLLIGRVFQDRTYQRMSFDRDYKSFFPLAVRRLDECGERTVPLSELAVGDRLRLRHGELVPADSRILSGTALIDYSFVTGESSPVEKGVGDLIYSGGRQVGGAMEIEIAKPVSQSYLTSLWSHEAFGKRRDNSLNALLNRFSRGFTLAVITLAIGAGAWWAIQHDAARAVRAFTSVLIVACPCALALSAPFALGTAQRLLGRFKVFARNSNVLEALARVDTIVFDKTGTLTVQEGGALQFAGKPLSQQEVCRVKSVASRSTHPHSVAIADSFAQQDACPVEQFREVPGKGIHGSVDGACVVLGSASWVRYNGVNNVPVIGSEQAEVHLAMDGAYRGSFLISGTVRPKVREMTSALNASHELLLLSGDNDTARAQFQGIFGGGSKMKFDQSPSDKLAAIEELQAQGRSVMMVGDGLNDAGALRQSDVGVAVVERVGAFSPASDIIMEASQVPSLAAIIRFSKQTVRVIWAGIILSLIYNGAGLTFAATGRLSPIVCAILMPLSSITVVTFACLAVGRAWQRAEFAKPTDKKTIP